MLRKTLSLATVVVLLPLVAVACGGTGQASSDGGRGKLTLVAYSTPREAYESIIPAFERSKAGEGVAFDQSYGSSGEQSRAVEQGLPADVVAFSLAPDVTRLVEAGLVDENWDEGEYRGMVTDSVVVLVVREGNPKGIHDWDDLVREDVEVITPNPFTSGGARWNVMAAYGAQVERGASKEVGVDYLRRLFGNVPVQDKSAREALATFAGGKGDVMLAYENEAIFAQQAGEKIEYVVPDETILIENPVAVVNESKNRATAEAFVEYLRTPEAQRIFGQKGYRPVVEDVLREFDYAKPAKLFTIEDLGGWDRVMDEFFDRESGVMADIERDRGVAVE
ncbi:MAG: sulfate ABC transporter substrate-binding protein [Actinomycetota bacterium]|nr:sulfate ABC transporter substrate-binding protein [Actinomycetota bacterium]